jgi:hypothetical protein
MSACVAKKMRSFFQLGHNVGVSLDLLMLNVFAADHLGHPDEVRRQTFKGDYCVTWIQIALKLIRCRPTLHTSRLSFPRLRLWSQFEASPGSWVVNTKDSSMGVGYEALLIFS